VLDTLKGFGIGPKRTSFGSSWQNGIAERWVGNCRRDLLDHVIALNARHLKRPMNDCVRYYHDARKLGSLPFSRRPLLIHERDRVALRDAIE
jgi:transposase InsO family protein